MVLYIAAKWRSLADEYEAVGRLASQRSFLGISGGGFLER